MTIMQCMGGFCRKREQCAHYSAPPIAGRAPVERLCPPGKDEPEVAKLAADPRFAGWIAGMPEGVQR